VLCSMTPTQQCQHEGKMRLLQVAVLGAIHAGCIGVGVHLDVFLLSGKCQLRMV